MRGYEKDYGPFEGSKSWEKVLLRFDAFAGFEEPTPDEPDSFTIDSGDISVGTIPGLEKVFGLSHIEDPEVERIKGINHTRAGTSMQAKATLEK